MHALMEARKNAPTGQKYYVSGHTSCSGGINKGAITSKIKHAI